MEGASNVQKRERGGSPDAAAVAKKQNTGVLITDCEKFMKVKDRLWEMINDRMLVDEPEPVIDHDVFSFTMLLAQHKVIDELHEKLFTGYIHMNEDDMELGRVMNAWCDDMKEVRNYDRNAAFWHDTDGNEERGDLNQYLVALRGAYPAIHNEGIRLLFDTCHSILAEHVEYLYGIEGVMERNFAFQWRLFYIVGILMEALFCEE